jgi:trans-2,3-dihydro-3-hydroxyanthranilate isomerase
MPTLPLTVVDVFTSQALTGNGLAVVHDADEIGEQVMHAFARETRLSETTFVQHPSDRAASYRNRIWTVGEEIPFAGHPSLGTAAAVAWRRGEARASYSQETGAGLQEVEVELRSETHAVASMLQERPSFGEAVQAEPLLSAVGLTRADAHPHWTAQVVSTGLPATLVPLASEEAIARARPDWEQLRRLACNSYFFWADPVKGQAAARCFPPSHSEGEDPATGSAAGALMAYMAFRAGLDRLQIRQGREIGRPSLIEASIGDGWRPRVRGEVVLLVTGEVRLPDEWAAG